MHGEGGTLSGNVSAGQSLGDREHQQRARQGHVAASFTNAGSITLTNGDVSANNAYARRSPRGTLTNSGTITTEAGRRRARARSRATSRTPARSRSTRPPRTTASASLTNEGAIKLADGRELTVSNKRRRRATARGGKIVAGDGAAVDLIEPGTAFTEGAGTTSGTKPVIIRDGALSYTGSGASMIASTAKAARSAAASPPARSC